MGGGNEPVDFGALRELEDDRKILAPPPPARVPAKGHQRTPRTNTQADQRGSRPPANFHSQVSSQHLEELMKATYARGVTVYEHFARLATRQGNQLQLAALQFQKAVLDLEIQWDSRTVHLVYTQINKQFNSRIGFGTTHAGASVSPDQVDEAVAFGVKLSCEELHRQLLGAVNSTVQSTRMNLDQMF